MKGRTRFSGIIVITILALVLAACGAPAAAQAEEAAAPAKDSDAAHEVAQIAVEQGDAVVSTAMVAEVNIERHSHRFSLTLPGA